MQLCGKDGIWMLSAEPRDAPLDLEIVLALDLGEMLAGIKRRISHDVILAPSFAIGSSLIIAAVWSMVSRPG